MQSQSQPPKQPTPPKPNDEPEISMKKERRKVQRSAPAPPSGKEPILCRCSIPAPRIPVGCAWPWRRRRPPASAGVHCGQGNGSIYLHSRLQENLCIPACRMWYTYHIQFLPAGRNAHSCRSAGVDCGGRNGQSCRSSFLTTGMCVPVVDRNGYSPARSGHLRLPGGAAGAMSPRREDAHLKCSDFLPDCTHILLELL